MADNGDEIERLRAALREIADLAEGKERWTEEDEDGFCHKLTPREIARRALAEIEEVEGE